MLRFIGTWVATLAALGVLTALFGIFFGNAAIWLAAVTAVAVLFALFSLLSRENDELRKRIEKLEAQLSADETAEAAPAED